MCILVVEDDDEQRLNLVEMFREAGRDVVEADTGDKAVALILNPVANYEALITDYNLPGPINGGQVAEYMRKRWPEMPIVIVTGRPEVFQPNWNNELNYVCLQKPYGLFNLILLVEDLISPQVHSSARTEV